MKFEKTLLAIAFYFFLFASGVIFSKMLDHLGDFGYANFFSWGESYTQVDPAIELENCKADLQSEMLKAETCKVALMGVDEGVVERIVDGDTLEIAGQTIRVLGIDTPEIDHGKNRPAEPFGYEAMDFATEKLLGKKVKLQAGPENLGRFCRQLRLVWYQDEESGEWKLFDREILEKGLAEPLFYNQNIPWKAEMEAAMKDAQENKRGIWSVK